MADDDLDDYFDSLPDQVKDAVAGAVQKEAEDLSKAQHAALLALESAPEETGDLAASCQAVPGDSDLEWVVQAGGSGVGYDYGEAFEYGTRHQPARPFFWSTYRDRKEQIEQNIADAIDEALK